MVLFNRFELYTPWNGTYVSFDTLNNTNQVASAVWLCLYSSYNVSAHIICYISIFIIICSYYRRVIIWNHYISVIVTAMVLPAVNQCWLVIKWTFGNEFQWNLKQNLFIQENAFENVVCKMADNLSGSQFVNIYQITLLYSVILYRIHNHNFWPRRRYIHKYIFIS